jgi:serine/threonine protein phosphatase 1
LTQKKQLKKTRNTTNSVRTTFLDAFSYNRIWVIPDIHACYKSIKSLVGRIDPKKGKDLLIFLGDYINKGPEPEKTLDFLKGIQESLSTFFLLGNHDQMLLDYWDRHDHLLQEQLVALNSETLFDKEEAYGPFFKQTYYYLETDDYFLVHAGFNFETEDPFVDRQSMQNIREITYSKEKARGKRIIRGHFPHHLDVIKEMISRNADVISLDNGCVYNDREGQGNLLALNLKDRSLLVQKNIDQT